MPFAITLPLDRLAASRVTALWETHPRHEGLSADSLQLGYAPHLTLAICSNGTSPERLVAAVQAVASHSPLFLVLERLDLFAGQPAVLFLAPVVTPALLALHAACLTELPASALDPHYREGTWVPHVTLAKDLRAPARALTVLTHVTLPLRTRIEAV